MRIDAAIPADKSHGFHRGSPIFVVIEIAVVNTAKEVTTEREKGSTTLDMKNPLISAKWDCIMKALKKMDALSYLRRIAGSYCTKRALKYDTGFDTKEYYIIDRLP